MNTAQKDKFQKFINLIDFFKSKWKTNILEIKSEDKLNKFSSVWNDLSILKEKCLNDRFNEARRLFLEKKDSVKISTFELMQYDFHENTHSNVLQYLFDYRLSGDLGVKILKSFLEKIGTSES